jgi:hypothetical protein
MKVIRGRHCEERNDEAIQTVSVVKSLDCFVEFIIGRRFAPTRWLAMTKSNVRFR